MVQLTRLPDRSVILVEGEDRVPLLQGLVSNDIEALGPGRAVWAALLTAQGKWLADFFVYTEADRLLLDCEAEQVPMLIQRLSRYRLRMKAALRPEPAIHVYVAWNGRPDVVGTIAADPRLPNFAWRILTTDEPPSTATPEAWDMRRLAAGLPDGSKDLESDRSILLEAGFDELDGVSWSKGCYMGQELTARTKYRGLIKRRLVPVAVDGALPLSGTPVLKCGMEVGSMRSGRDGIGLASVRLDALDGLLECGEATLTPVIPAWMRFTQKAATGT